MSNVKVNVSYKGFERELSRLAYGLSKMTDGYLKEIAEAGKETAERAYAEYDAEDYSGIMPHPRVMVKKTKKNNYDLTVTGTNVDLLEYGTGFLKFDYEGELPPGWADHEPREEVSANGTGGLVWFFSTPPGMRETGNAHFARYRVAIPEPKMPEFDAKHSTPDEYDRMMNAYEKALEAWENLDNPFESRVKETSMVTSGHPPANALPQAFDVMVEKAEESAKHFYQRKYK